MKKLILLIALVMTVSAASAQLFKKKDKTVEPQYKEGMVPVVNGKVTFDPEKHRRQADHHLLVAYL